MTQCQHTKANIDCTCTYEPCPRKGKCCECITYHRRNGELPGCLFDKETERSYDRSISRFIESNRMKNR